MISLYKVWIGLKDMVKVHLAVFEETKSLVHGRSMHVVFCKLCWLQFQQIVPSQLYASGEEHEGLVILLLLGMQSRQFKSNRVIC